MGESVIESKRNAWWKNTDRQTANLQASRRTSHLQQFRLASGVSETGGGGGWRWDGGDVGSGKGPARARDTALQPLQHSPLSVRQLVGAVLEGDAAPGGGLDAEASAAEGRTVMKEAYESGIQPWCQKLLWTQGKGGLLTPPTR